jgi:arylsulfatase
MQNLVLLVIDSLRADHLSGLGYPLPTTPYLNTLMERSAVFTRFFTPVTPTQPAITTLFTGQFPWVHGILAQSGFNSLPRNAPWLPETLRRNGYATAALDNLAQAKKWFVRGFKDYMNLRTRSDEYYPWSRLNQHALKWLERYGSKKFFLYIRYGDPHTPYQPPPPYDGIFYAGDPTRRNAGSLNAFYERPLKRELISGWLEPAALRWPGATGPRIEDIEWVRAQYDGEIRSVDDGIKELIGFLEHRGLQENTIVVVVGDHGESLGEHGIYFEHHGLYECCLRPPLIIHWPGVTKKKRNIETITQLPDLAPTLLDMMGLAVRRR